MFIKTGETRPEMDSFSSKSASIFCLHRIGLSREECPGDRDQLDLTDKMLEEEKTSNQEGRGYAVWSCREMIVLAAEKKAHLFLLLQIQRALAFLLMAVLWERDLLGCPHVITTAKVPMQ